jgi:glycosyltransferase involved in cell wall biosynthesis
MTRRISVVIPAYNEALRLPGTLDRISRYAEEGNVAIAEIVVVDDGSRDRTSVVARTTKCSVPVRCVTYHPNSGKGYAVRRGAIEAAGDLVLISDADMSTPIEEVEKLLAALDDADVAIGSRAIDRSLVQISQPWVRDRMGRVFNWLIRRITGMPFHDTQCGFKLLRAADARELFAVAIVDGFAWDVELLLLAGRWDLTVTEVPVRWFNSPQSRVSIFGDPLKMLRDVVRLRLRLGRFRGARPVVTSGS